MKDKQNALSLLTMAEKELTALRCMGNSSSFSDEIFGFHAQQVLEKCFKAWLALLDQKYPHTHDISMLLKQLEESGCPVASLWEYADMSAFAMNIRYEGTDETATPLDRQAIVKDLHELYETVQKIVK